MNDYSNFNNILESVGTIFQIITLEGWSKLMYNYQDSVNSVTASVFFVSVVIIGSFISLNLVIAQIMHSFNEQDLQRL